MRETWSGGEKVDVKVELKWDKTHWESLSFQSNPFSLSKPDPE